MKSYWAFAFIFISGCVQKIEFLERSFDKEYIVFCTITKGKIAELSLSESYSINSVHPPEPIPNAEIVLNWDNQSDTLKYSQDNVYKGERILEVASYELSIKLPNGKLLTASTDIPESSYPLESFYIRNAGRDQYGDAITEYRIRLNDDGKVLNYFEMLLFGLNVNKTAIDYDTNDFAVGSDPVILAEGLEGFKNTSFLFRDELFSGQQYEIVIRKLPMGYGALIPDFVENLQGGRPYVMLRSCSYEYYNFRKSWVRHQYHQQTRPEFLSSGFIISDISDFLFKGTVEPLESNINGGLGVFAGYSDTFTPLRIIDGGS